MCQKHEEQLIKTNDQQKGQTETISKLFRFEVMLKAIDFYSQSFNLETLLSSTSDFVNESLTLDSSALFLINDKKDKYTMYNSRKYSINNYEIESSDNLNRIAYLYGDIITKNFELFFDPSFIDTFNPKLVIPLIDMSRLTGFIVTDGKALGEFIEEDFAMASGLMRIFKNSLERLLLKEELSKILSQHNDESFSIYAINERTREILSEHNINNMLTTSIDAISELTGSLDTYFGFLGEDHECIEVILGNNLNHKAEETNKVIKLKTKSLKNNLRFFDISSDFELLKEIFENPEKLHELNAVKIILICTSKIIGFVTLGKRMTGEDYTQTAMEAVELLAFTNYLAKKAREHNINKN